MLTSHLEKITEISKETFEGQALKIYYQQYQHNDIYRKFVDLARKHRQEVTRLDQIPFLPISFFKSHKIKTTAFEEMLVYESSGTTGSIASRHFLKDTSIYEISILTAFEQFYGPAHQYCFLALLPSYLERRSSSLVFMTKVLMEKSAHPMNGFYLDDYEALYNTLQKLEAQKQKIILIGVTYALLDFAALHPQLLQHTIVIETGGMKGRKEELVRNEVHERLKKAFSLASIHSEYGMTELLSQAYAIKEGKFHTPQWLKIILREEDDPKQLIIKTAVPKTGLINIIDLANIYSCSFIATDDVGRLHPDESFEVLGRMDNTDIRGCSLLAV
ncbi:MAG: acyl transferase [Bacteroidota bacterium]|nr:acyl transferase [Bacteroidota bacterium]